MKNIKRHRIPPYTLFCTLFKLVFQYLLQRKWIINLPFATYYETNIRSNSFFFVIRNSVKMRSK